MRIYWLVVILFLGVSESTWSKSCLDTDLDRLCDAVETNTGIFVSITNTGSNPNIADTDGDAINDGDEVLGPANGLSFAGLNMDPNIRQILVEIDWTFDPSVGETQATHDPSSDAAFLHSATLAFFKLPAFSSAGHQEGVKLVAPTHSYGNNPIQVSGPLTFADLATLKSTNMDPRKVGYFRYMLITGRIAGGWAGYAELFGDDLMVIDARTAYPGFSRELNNWFMGLNIAHELGHNLNLHHGGADACNNKPNYLSLMNYTYNTGKYLAGCEVIRYGGMTPSLETPSGTFSLGGMQSISEGALDETSGICPGSMNWRDFNNNGIRESGTYALKITTDCGSAPAILHDYNDYQLMDFRGILPAFRNSAQIIH